MEKRYYSRLEPTAPDKQLHEAEEGDEGLGEFRLPINHKPTENVDLENVEHRQT